MRHSALVPPRWPVGRSGCELAYREGLNPRRALVYSKGTLFLPSDSESHAKGVGFAVSYVPRTECRPVAASCSDMACNSKLDSPEQLAASLDHTGERIAASDFRFDLQLELCQAEAALVARKHIEGLKFA